MSEQRRFPRHVLSQPGEVELRPGGNVKVTINSVAPEGVGMLVRDTGVELEPGTLCTLRFTADDIRLELPGSIVWFSGVRPTHQRSDVGIRLHLEEASGDSREAYARWVIDKLSA